MKRQVIAKLFMRQVSKQQKRERNENFGEKEGHEIHDP